MAERLNTFTVPSDAVQGVGSSVTFRRLTYAGLRALQNWPKGADVDPVADEARGRAFMVERITAWDWVDEDGTPLPLPKADPDVLDRLTLPERDFLMSNATGAAQAKN